MASSAREWRELERQVALLEHGGGGDGCPRCRGIRIVIRSSENNALHTATSTYSGKTEDLSENELAERETETTCPRCGSRR